MHIEDLISILVYGRITLNSWDQTVVYSFHDQISCGNGLTEKQSILALRILKKSATALSAAIRQNVDPFLQSPTFRLPIRKISSEKRLSIVEHETLGRVIKAVFPYNEKTVEQIRKNRDTIGHAQWNKDEKCWIFALNEQSLQFLTDIDTFDTDDTIKKLQDQIADIHKNIENYVPMLIIENLKPKLKNCDKNTPILDSNDLVSAIFEARKRGVCTWDETIDNFVESDEINPLTRAFIKSDPGIKFGVDSDVYCLDELSTVILNLLPVMVIIPGGDELDKMTIACKFFRELGIVNKDMSAMFRLPSNTHATFNEFVKFNELNSPISENTKVAFVSGKIPKPIFKSKIKFNCILNLGYNNVHYTMHDFVKNHENSIMYSKEKDIKNLRHGFL